MIISQGRGYIFVHIPKTGGTALSLALESRAMKDDLLIGDTPKAKRRKHRLKGLSTRGRLWKHSTLADIDGLLSVEEIGSLFAFTMVRNPWDRVVSYYHWLRNQDFDHKAVALAKSLDFKPFVQHPSVLSSFRTSPAAHYMRRADGVVQCASYIRLEHFRADCRALCQHLGFDLELPHENRSERNRDWRPYYDDRTAQLISSVCSNDIEAFGYRFEDASAF